MTQRTDIRASFGGGKSQWITEATRILYSHSDSNSSFGMVLGGSYYATVLTCNWYTTVFLSERSAWQTSWLRVLCLKSLTRKCTKRGSFLFAKLTNAQKTGGIAYRTNKAKNRSKLVRWLEPRSKPTIEHSPVQANKPNRANITNRSCVTLLLLAGADTHHAMLRPMSQVIGLEKMGVKWANPFFKSF